MKRKYAFCEFLILVSLLLFALSASRGYALDTAGPGPTPTGSAAGETVEPEATAPPESEDPAATEVFVDVVASRTPVPTATPGLVQEEITEFVASTGLAGETYLGLTAEDWINLGISALIVLLGYAVGTWLIRRFLRRVVRRTPTEFDDLFLEAIGSQLRWLVAIFCLHFATARLGFLSPELRRLLLDVIFVLGLTIGISVGWKLISLAFTWYHEHLASDEDRERLDPILTLLRRIVLIVWAMIGVVFLLGHFGLNITAVAAALGIAGLALSLAAQDTIADAISGFVILMDQPFRIGDRIEISDLGTWGDVVEIGTRTTRIRTRDNRLVIIPNSTIGKNQVVNYTYPDPQYRVQVDIGIGYGMDIEKTRQIIVDTMRGLEGVLQDKPVDALYNEMGDSAIMFRVRWWIESYADTRRIFDRVNTALQVALDEAGIEMPFPTQTVNLQVDQETAKRFVQTIQQPDMAK